LELELRPGERSSGTEHCRERNMDVELELQLQSGECPTG